VRINQRWFVWLILALCVLAAPVALLTQVSTNQQSQSQSQSVLTTFKDHIEVIKLTGMIIDDEETGLFERSKGSSAAVLKHLRKALKNEKVKAILLRVNSPGGTVPTSQEIHEAVIALQKKGKPVVVSMGDVAASGGYYVSCGADKIFANPGTLTGSIGVIINLMNFKGLADKLGVEPEVIKSGTFKDIASPYRKLTKEDEEILHNLIMDSYEQFTSAISEGRKLPIEQVKGIADGRIYSGRQAQKLGLIDELGSYTDALACLQKICKDKYKLKDDLPVDEGSGSSLFSSLMESKMSLPNENSELARVLPLQVDSRLYKQPLWLMQ
jgi:protease IV